MDKPLLIKFIKCMNYICALLMLVDVLFRFASFKTETDPFFFLLTFYLLAFSALLIVSELGIKKILVYVEFLNGRAGKGFYVLFVGLLIFDQNRPSDMAIAIVLVMVGLFNILASCMRDTKFNYDEEYGSEEDEETERHPLQAETSGPPRQLLNEQPIINYGTTDDQKKSSLL